MNITKENLSGVDMVARILDAYALSSETVRAQGREWYPMFRDVCENTARRHGLDVESVIHAAAALSPRVTVKRNIEMLEILCANFAKDASMNPRTLRLGMGHFVDTAWACLSGARLTFNTNASGEHDGAQKTRSFAQNILGDENLVTVDVWATRAAAGPDFVGQPNGVSYRMIRDAYRTAAERVGESPRDMQAIVWIVYRGEAN